jgi:hypothetical protein
MHKILKMHKILLSALKKKFPRLSIILLTDSLYASERALSICGENNFSKQKMEDLTVRRTIIEISPLHVIVYKYHYLHQIINYKII